MIHMGLFPKIKPYRNGYLRVSRVHRIYYELCGNQHKLPVLFVHGGPGAGCSENDRRFFNPKKFNTILFDQRGANRSKPFASIQENTTWHLIKDMEKILNLLGIKKVFLFGGSWGSTLSLAFAINYPERVSGMLLRGIFIPSKEDTEHFLKGGTEKFFPEAWQRFISIIPKKHRNDPAKYYLRQMTTGSRKKRKKHAFEWAFYEISLLRLNIPEKEVLEKMKSFPYEAMSVLESYYLSNNCFLPKDYILKNAKKIAEIPTAIVHGRYDMICIPKAAYLLHKSLPKSKLYFVTGGHGSGEQAIKEKLVEEMNKYARNPKKWPN